MIKLRDYQAECLDVIKKKDRGKYLIQMATGLGKTVTFANVNRNGRMLILSHRDELVHQPLKYFDCPTGVEMSKERSNGQDVISACVPSMIHRLDKFSPSDFDVIIVDEAHHSAAKSYRKIIDYFKPRLLLGFTATPNRADNARLDSVYEDIIFQRDLRWGIKNGYLCDILCKRVDIGFNLSNVKVTRGDYAPNELEDAMDGTADAIAEAYEKHANGATLIFACSVEQAKEIAKRIPKAEVVTGETKNRAEIIDRFTKREIPCLVNCMVFTEGTDIPLVETVIIARPTHSDSLYTQMVGRGLRLYEGKEKLTLIDCVGIAGKASLCTAPTLLGIDLDSTPESKRKEIEGPLFELPEKIETLSDCPESWIKNVKIVDLWSKEQEYNLHDINFFKMPNGDLICSLPKKTKIVIPCQNELGQTVFEGEKMYMQQAIDKAYKLLKENYANEKCIWDLNACKKWGKYSASEKQLNLIKKKGKKLLAKSELDIDNLTKLEASQILNRIFNDNRSA